MIAILGASIFGVIAVLDLLITLGLPLGEFTLGGKHKVLPPKMRIASGVSFFVQIFAAVIILQVGGIVPFWFSEGISKGICYFFAAYLSLNTVMNISSKSKKERYVMTPLALLAAICFWITAISV